MIYQPGDYVCPSDLPRRFPCRVERAESMRMPDGFAQVLHLVPLAGPWPQGTVLIRLCKAVMPVRPGDWQAALPTRLRVEHPQHAA